MEPTLVPAEPVHDEPTDFRGAMRHQLHANLAAVGGLADLSDLARKLQPDLIPTNVTVNEDTVSALLASGHRADARAGGPGAMGSDDGA